MGAMQIFTVALLCAMTGCGVWKETSDPVPSRDAGSPLGSDFSQRCSESSDKEKPARLAPSFAVAGNKIAAFNSVALITLRSGSVCSAVLLDSHRLVTAAHCFESQELPVSIEFKDADGTMSVDLLGAKVILHPTYAAALAQGDSLERNPALVNFDVAVIKLQVAISDRQPVKTAVESQLPAGKLVAVIGYGDTGLGAGTRRFAYSHVGADIVDSEIGGKRFSKVLALNSKSGTGACQGDSGGGIFVQHGEGWELLAVVSGVNNVVYPKLPLSDCHRCPDGVGIAARISGQRAFLSGAGR
jgi:Trypsin